MARCILLKTSIPTKSTWIIWTTTLRKIKVMHQVEFRAKLRKLEVTSTRKTTSSEKSSLKMRLRIFVDHTWVAILSKTNSSTRHLTKLNNSKFLWCKLKLKVRDKWVLNRLSRNHKVEQTWTNSATRATHQHQTATIAFSWAVESKWVSNSKPKKAWMASWIATSVIAWEMLAISKTATIWLAPLSGLNHPLSTSTSFLKPARLKNVMRRALTWALAFHSRCLTITRNV